MIAIILAGGKGTRLPESAKNIPKALVSINNKAIIQHQLDQLEKHGITDVIFALGFRHDHIIEHIKGKYRYVIEKEPLGTGGAIKFASKGLTEPFLVLNGDILSDFDFSAFIDHFNNKKGIKGSLGLIWMENAKDYGLVLHENEVINVFTEKPQEPIAGHINTGFYILHPEIFNSIEQESFSIEKELFPKLADDKVLSAFIHSGEWLDVGTEDRLKQARLRDWLNL